MTAFRAKRARLALQHTALTTTMRCLAVDAREAAGPVVENKSKPSQKNEAHVTLSLTTTA
jgi:hypothetical protein